MRKYILVLLSLLVGLALATLNSDTLPDYLAYEYMYDYAYSSLDDLSFQDLGTNLVAGSFSVALFNAALSLLTSFFPSYAIFRVFLIVAAVIVSYVLLLRRLSASSRCLGLKEIFSLAFCAFLLVVPWLEYYLVRLRAGFSILFFLVFLVLVQELFRVSIKSHPFRYVSICSLSAFSFLVSLASHSSTFAALSFFIVLPYSVQHLLSRSSYGSFFATTIYSLSSYSLLLYASSLSEVRGSHLESALNPYRMFSIFFIPIIIILLLYLRQPSILKSMASPASPTYNGFTHIYISSCIPSIILYYVGSFSVSGEAIVRVMTISTVPALLSLSRMRLFSTQSIFPVYIVVCNSAFFLQTVFWSS